MPELKPCPFCGAPAVFGEIPDYKNNRFVYAGECSDKRCVLGGFGDFCGDDKEKAAAIWNRRVECAPERQYPPESEWTVTP